MGSVQKPTRVPTDMPEPFIFNTLVMVVSEFVIVVMIS